MPLEHSHHPILPSLPPGFGLVLSAILCLTSFLVLSLAAPAGEEKQPKKEKGFITLCYHDVRPEVNDLVIIPDAMPVTVLRLTDQFEWLKKNNYQVIGVDDILAARRGEKELPDKAVFLTFDDGLSSFRHVVYPLLLTYNYKALLALETNWLEQPFDQPVTYGDTVQLARTYFLTWDEIREMADSGLVELASHSHDLHRTHLSTPQGIRQPAAATLAYNPESGTYETPDSYYQRIKTDVSRSSDIIFEHTGKRPRVMVWPYGRYTQPGVKAALDSGYLLSASLGMFNDGDTIPRLLIYQTLELPSVMVDVERGTESGNSLFDHPNREKEYRDLILPVYDPQRVVHADLDYLYDPDPAQQESNISAFFDRVNSLQINTIYLQAYSDPDGNGTADALYFPNRHLPVRADLFNYLAWQLMTRLGVNVYAWMPVLGFEIPGRPLVQASPPDQRGSPYNRLTPFDPENQRIIKEIYQDLAMHSITSGILYHDDAILGDYEDASPSALAWLKELGFAFPPETIRSDPELAYYHSRLKSTFLINFINDLTAAMQTWRPPLLTARNLYAMVVMEPYSETWFGQNFVDFLDNYDYVGLMAMPYMEGEADAPMAWLRRLAERVKGYPTGPQKTVFELQAIDWRQGDGGPISSEELAEQMILLQKEGIGNIGYYPDNPITQHPDVNVIYPAFSLNSNPYTHRPYRLPPGGRAVTSPHVGSVEVAPPAVPTPSVPRSAPPPAPVEEVKAVPPSVPAPPPVEINVPPPTLGGEGEVKALDDVVANTASEPTAENASPVETPVPAGN
ncbi:MAG: poly-beta-1,6-N-acetyl-D-glucosamine N-deacetylase PgaB [Planctomycetota bacterium]|jgi:biofilm PGA synthesis lipoprotein PgaB|nr:poly-beta-1,6-N-acetyl-D-glucosamine N-deacetylase PgaB [Planctomycetota bacterium]